MVMRPPLINVMARAAEKAARGLRRDFGEVENLQISRKGPADFVSNADIQAQKILVEELGKARPAFGFLVEEADASIDMSPKAERWIIDPLDGTTNFLHGMPHWCISIAAERNGEIVAGYIFNPITDESFWAEKGTGAFQDDRRLRVSARSDLADCLVGVGLPFRGSRSPIPRASAELLAVMPQVAGVRRMGAAALDLAYVAAGRYDAYWETGVYPWDVAAGALIVKEAGGIVTSLSQNPNPVESGALLASNGAIHDKMATLLKTESA